MAWFFMPHIISNARRAVGSAGDVPAPDVVDTVGGVVGADNGLNHRSPAVVEERVRAVRCDLLDAAAEVVIAVGDDERIVGVHSNEP